jgi:hypothetical protein
MDNNSSVQSGGIGFSGLLAILFIALKLTGVIAWSWVWVLSPLWIPLVLLAVILIAFGAICLLVALWSSR